MAALNADFVTYKGDSPKPIFTVLTGANGTAVDISGCTEIIWTVQQQAETAVVLTKKLSTGGIAFVGGGTTGQFQVTITSADTAALDGYYMHQASITDAQSNITTVTVGRMQVGVKPNWTYNPTLIAIVPLYQVRRLIGDTLEADQQMQDQEILWQITQYGNIYSAASACARSLAAQFARLVDTIQGELRTLYGQKAKNYLAIAATLEAQGKGRSGALAYAGGISQTDKSNQVVDTDRVPPQFNLMMDDNLLPESPVGNLVPSAPQTPATGP